MIVIFLIKMVIFKKLFEMVQVLKMFLHIRSKNQAGDKLFHQKRTVCMIVNL